jgi:hypothetical protein
MKSFELSFCSGQQMSGRAEHKIDGSYYTTALPPRLCFPFQQQASDSFAPVCMLICKGKEFWRMPCRRSVGELSTKCKIIQTGVPRLGSGRKLHSVMDSLANLWPVVIRIGRRNIIESVLVLVGGRESGILEDLKRTYLAGGVRYRNNPR